MLIKSLLQGGWEQAKIDAARLEFLGVFGVALHFNGRNDMIPIGRDKSLRISEGTMMNWINIQTSNDSGLSSMTPPYDDGPAWDAPYRSLGLGTWQGKLRYWIAIDDQNREIQPGKIEDDQWNHEAITYDGSPRRTFLDGELVEEVKDAGEITYGNPVPTAVIGSASVVVKREFFNGFVDEITIFDVALSEKEINELIDDGLGSTLAVHSTDKAATTWAEIKWH